MRKFGKYVETDKSSTLLERDFKGAVDIVIKGEALYREGSNGPQRSFLKEGKSFTLTAGIADIHRYSQMGNAVSVPVVRWIAERMKAEHERD